MSSLTALAVSKVKVRQRACTDVCSTVLFLLAFGGTCAVIGLKAIKGPMLRHGPMPTARSEESCAVLSVVTGRREY